MVRPKPTLKRLLDTSYGWPSSQDLRRDRRTLCTMLPEDYAWFERNGRAELVHRSYVVAIVSEYDGAAHVIIDCRMAWQQLHAREPNVGTARRHVERWFAARHKRTAGIHG